MKLRLFFSALIAGVLVLLLLGGGGFYWLISNSPLNLLSGGATTNPTAAIFVPKQAPVMVSLLVNPERLEAFSQVVAPITQRLRSRAELNQIKQSLLAGTDLEYYRDIHPWLGDEITWALTTPDIDRNRDNGLQPGYLLAVTTKDAEGSRQFLELFWEKQTVAGADLVFEQYKGVKLIYSNQPVLVSGTKSLTNLTTAVVGDRFVLFGNHPKVLRDAINNVQVANLTNSIQYQQALEKLTDQKIGLTFINLPAVKAGLGNDDSITENSQPFGSLAIALGINRQGLIADTSLIAANKENVTANPPALSQPVTALQYLPDSSFLGIAGNDLNQFWNQISATLKTDNTLSQLLNQSIVSLQKSWGISLPQDIFSWVQGEYALGMLPRSDRNEPDWIFVAEKSNLADEAIAHLDTVAKQQEFNVGLLPLDNQSIIGWTKLITVPVSKGKTQKVMKLEAQVQGVHTTVGKYEIFASSVEAIDQALKASDNSLLNSEKFQSAIAPLPQPNNGYVYLQWQNIKPILERQLPILKVVDLIGKPFLSHLRSLSLTSYGSENNVQHSKIFFQLGNIND
ncbi:MAG: DUF3352 domain-containing protein [Crinalium sp.]